MNVFQKIMGIWCIVTIFLALGTFPFGIFYFYLMVTYPFIGIATCVFIILSIINMILYFLFASEDNYLGGGIFTE